MSDPIELLPRDVNLLILSYIGDTAHDPSLRRVLLLSKPGETNFRMKSKSPSVYM